MAPPGDDAGYSKRGQFAAVHISGFLVLMSTENVTWAPHFCVLVLFWVPNILQCRESKLWGSTLTSKKEKKEHLGWKRWWFKLCLLFCISQSRIFIQCPILFWILLYPKNCPNRDAWDWVPSKNLWCSFENQAVIVMCTPDYNPTTLLLHYYTVIAL